MSIDLFCGHDEREAIGFHVFVASVIRHASQPFAIHPLGASAMPTGSNAFTLSRFLVPHLMRQKGRAIYVDACDMLMCADIAELDALFEPDKAVQVVQHRYSTKNPIKYLGTSMQCPNRDYPRKNWASVMLINCAHPAWDSITPAYLERAQMLDVLQLRFLADLEIGALPDEWNRIVDEGGDPEGAKLCHWTAGIPAFPMYRDAPAAGAWKWQRDRMLEIP